MEMLIRAATTADAGLVGRLLRDFNAEFDDVGSSAEELAGRFARLLAREDVLVLLAEEVGFAYLTYRPTPYSDGPLAQLEELYVVPHLRDQGIGTLLLTAAMTASRERGSEDMHIAVDEVDVDTRRFYERHGFSNVEEGTEDRMLFYERGL